MAATWRNFGLALGLLGSFTLGNGIADAKGKSVSSADADVRQRAGYQAPAGAQLIGEPVESPSGEDVAFFEQNGDGHQLVVCPHGGPPGRWTVKPETTKLKIFWTGPTQLVLGTDVLAPKMVVRWELARS